ncbi:MAG: serine/threonine protein kinase [Myxococcales bacterium]|nr:serine/threonine protein kinase [Myxococcales bacterium]
MSDGQATASKAPDPLIGRVIADRFRLTGLIARGGMGKVYRAEQSPLGRICAVKVLNPNYNGEADPEFHRRFYREASTAAKITHPNSVTIFDYGQTDDDIYYMAMEYLEGLTLHQAIRQSTTLPEERVARIARQICRALREAHALGVIHRDLKPANIFLVQNDDDDRDFVKVLDFGLVKHVSERPEDQLTQTGLFMGSPKYMAPEQIQGGHVDPRTDIYSLGIIMYEMLTGKVPFERPTSVNILMAHVGEPPPPMREVNPNLVCTPVFEDLVMRCIAKDPSERFSSMDEVLAAIKMATGASMTGQVAALHSGDWNTYPPPPVRQSQPPYTPNVSSSVPLPMAGTSHTPMPLLRSDLSSQLAPIAPRRSRAWIGLGVLAAAAVGGLLGLVAFRVRADISATPPTDRGPPPAAVSLASAAPATSSAAGAGAAAVAPVVVKLTTDPPGATVREGDKVVCAETPCDLQVTADASHKLTISKPGFVTESRDVDKATGALDLKLQKPAIRGARPTRPPPSRPPAGAKTGDPPPSTPAGFKDVPY